MTIEGTDEIIATRSKTYQELNGDLDDLPLTELFQLIHDHPGLVKTPIIMDEKRLQVGFHADEIRQFIPRKTRKYQWLNWRQGDGSFCFLFLRDANEFLLSLHTYIIGAICSIKEIKSNDHNEYCKKR